MPEPDGNPLKGSQRRPFKKSDAVGSQLVPASPGAERRFEAKVTECPGELPLLDAEQLDEPGKFAYPGLGKPENGFFESW